MKQVEFSRFSVRYLLVVCVLLVISSSVHGVVVAPSPTSTSSLSSLEPTSAASSTSVPQTLSSTPLPEPPYNCSTGPEGQELDRFLIATNRVYLDISVPVNCSGVIVRWHYCHFIIGFRNATSSLSFCAWRRSNDSEELTYEIVGCNTLTTVPGDGESFRCRQYVPSNPTEIITVEEGDYIGFYVPDSALLPALSVPENDRDNYQLIRNVTGPASTLKYSELRNLSCTPNCGRALLKADIGEAVIYQHTIIM